jgi:hypothetical protein
MIKLLCPNKLELIFIAIEMALFILGTILHMLGW